MKTMYILTAVNIVISSATLAIVIIGGRKAKQEVVTVRQNIKINFDKMKRALNEIEI